MSCRLSQGPQCPPPVVCYAGLRVVLSSKGVRCAQTSLASATSALGMLGTGILVESANSEAGICHRLTSAIRPAAVPWVSQSWVCALASSKAISSEQPSEVAVALFSGSCRRVDHTVAELELRRDFGKTRAT